MHPNRPQCSLCNGNEVAVLGAPFSSLRCHTSWLAGCTDLCINTAFNCLVLCIMQIPVHRRHLGKFKCCFASVDGGSFPRECLLLPLELHQSEEMADIFFGRSVKRDKNSNFWEKDVPCCAVRVWSSFAGSWHWDTAFVEADGLGLVSSSSSATHRDLSCRWAGTLLSFLS